MGKFQDLFQKVSTSIAACNADDCTFCSYKNFSHVAPDSKSPLECQGHLNADENKLLKLMKYLDTICEGVK